MGIIGILPYPKKILKKNDKVCSDDVTQVAKLFEAKNVKPADLLHYYIL